MKIYSWNMLLSNKRLDRALAFIRTVACDVFCLQEVPEHFLKHLRALPYHMVLAQEANRRYAGVNGANYLVILSKHPIRAHSHIAMPHTEPSRITKSFTSFLYWLRLWAQLVGDRHHLYADIETPHGLMRVFCLHLPLTHPQMRAEEFELALAHRNNDIPTIVCGDFNILERSHVTPLNWISGGSVRDALPQRERRAIEERFFAYELVNAHRGHSTHPFSRSQLDHILVPTHFTITNAHVIKHTYGSDHRPITVEISPQPTT